VHFHVAFSLGSSGGSALKHNLARTERGDLRSVPRKRPPSLTSHVSLSHHDRRAGGGLQRIGDVAARGRAESAGSTKCGGFGSSGTLAINMDDPGP
jgi:hypothetical protein